MTLGTMYPGQAQSLQTTLVSNINGSTQTIEVVDASVLPAAPNIFVIGTGELSETVYYPTDAVANVFSGVTRHFQGATSAWDSGTVVARLFTAYDYDTLRTNFGEVIANNLVTAKGDVITASAASTPSVVAIGTEGQVLTVASDGMPDWAEPTSGVTEVTGATPIVSSGGNQPAISILVATPSDNGAMSAADKTKLDLIEDAADVTDATNVAAAGAIMDTTYHTKGALVIASAVDTPVALAVGTDGQVLTSQVDGTVAWEDPATAGGMVQSISAGDSSITIVGTTTPTIAVTTAGVTLAKMANLAQDTLIGRSTASTGVPEVISCTSAGRALLDDANASAQRTTLGISVTASAPITATASTTPVIAINAATTSTSGSMSAANFNKLSGLMWDAIVYQDATTTYAVSKAGVVLSSGARSSYNDNVHIQSALDYLDGLSITNNAYPQYTYGSHLYISTGTYYLQDTLYIRNSHKITGAGKVNTIFYAYGTWAADKGLVLIGASPIYTGGGTWSTTSVVCSSLPTSIGGVNVPDDYYKSGRVYNITQKLYASISAYTSSSKTITHGTIAGQTNTDSIVIGRSFGKNCRISDMSFNGQYKASYCISFCPEIFKNFGITEILFDNCSFRTAIKWGVLENSNYSNMYLNCAFEYNGVAPTVTASSYTSEAGSGNRYVVCSALPSAVDNYYIGWYCWNTNTNTGRIVNGYTGSTHTLDFAYNNWNQFSEAAWTVGNTFKMFPPWAGMYIKGSNSTHVYGGNADGNLNGFITTSTCGAVVRDTVVEGNYYNGIVAFQTMEPDFIGNQQWQLLLDNNYFEGNGVYNTIGTTDTVGLHDNFIADTRCDGTTISNAFSSDSTLTAARNSMSLRSYGDYTYVTNYFSYRTRALGDAPSLNHSVQGTGSQFVWERAGVSPTTVADTGTITHDLGTTPTWAQVTGSDTTGDIIAVSAMSSTTLTISIKKRADGTAGTAKVLYWRCGVT